MTIVTGHFNKPLVLMYDQDLSKKLKRDFWIVGQSFRYYLGGSPEGQYVEVPEGFIVSGAILRAPFRWLTPIWGRYGQALVMMSYLHQTRQFHYGVEVHYLSRKDIEQLFCEALSVMGVHPWIEKYLNFMFGVGRMLRVEIDTVTDFQANLFKHSET